MSWSRTKGQIDAGQPASAQLLSVNPLGGHYVVIRGYRTYWDKKAKKRIYKYGFMDPYLSAFHEGTAQDFVNLSVKAPLWDGGFRYQWVSSIYGIKV